MMNRIAEMMYEIRIKFSFIIFPIISFIGGIWQGQYTDDGYHWGFIFANGLDIINGKVPFKEIFITSSNGIFLNGLC